MGKQHWLRWVNIVFIWRDDGDDAKANALIMMMLLLMYLIYMDKNTNWATATIYENEFILLEN